MDFGRWNENVASVREPIRSYQRPTTILPRAYNGILAFPGWIGGDDHERVCFARVQGSAARAGGGGPPPARAIPDPGLSCPLGRAGAAHAARPVGLPGRWGDRSGAELDLERVPGAAARDADGRYPLRHQVVEAGYGLGGHRDRFPAGRRASHRAVPDCSLRRRVYDQFAARGRNWRQGVGGVPVRRPAARSRAWRSGPAAGAPSLLLEERQVGPPPRARPRRSKGLLGIARLSQLW